MEVLFSIPTQTRSNLTVTVPQRERRRIGTRCIELWVNIASGSGEVRVALDWTMPDGATGHTPAVFRGVGLHKVGFWRACAVDGNVAIGGTAEVVGSVRFSAQLVGIDAGEDVT